MILVAVDVMSTMDIINMFAETYLYFGDDPKLKMYFLIGLGTIIFVLTLATCAMFADNRKEFLSVLSFCLTVTSIFIISSVAIISHASVNAIHNLSSQTTYVKSVEKRSDGLVDIHGSNEESYRAQPQTIKEGDLITVKTLKDKVVTIKKEAIQ